MRLLVFSALVAVGLPLIAQTGCGSRSQNGTPPRTSGRLELSSDSFPLSVTDVLGRKTELARPARRVVSLTPANTEILFAVGAEAQVVGVTTYCNYPAAAQKKQPVGGFSPKQISIEKIVELKPDLVLAGGGIQRSTIEAVQRLKIPVIAVEPRTFDDLFSTIESIGRLTGNREESTRLTKSMRERTERVQRAVEGIPEKERVRVFYQVAERPLMTAGPQSFIGQMLKMGGGRNIFRDVKKQYPHISEEAVLARDPDVILAPSHMGSGKSNVKTTSGWESITAVKSKRIHYLDGDLVSRPGPRLVDALEAAARAMYPERFPDRAD